MKIGSVNIEKGGTGKTTTTFNDGEYLALDSKVLLIDQDKSCNLSSRYLMSDKYDLGLIRPENRIGNLYSGGDLVPIKIHDNLDLIAGSPNLEEIEKDITPKPNNRLILFAWIRDNYEELSKKYDYILIDTHNDTSIITQNAWAVSDVVFGVSDPSMDGFLAIQKLDYDLQKLKQELIEVISKESYVTAEYKFVGNKIEHNTTSSREFLEMVEAEEKYLGSFAKKELLNSSNLEMTPIVEFAKDPKIFNKHKEFFDNTFTLYKK
ncbi:hypothetical protein A5881_003896 [Enterococcus termitis]